MKKIACQYAIVRFAPFIETGEFANVGIIMMAARERFFGFKLETRRHGRVTKFFEELDAKLYRATLFDLRAEFERVHDVLKTNGFDRRMTFNNLEVAQGLFNEITRPRETTIRFSEPRVVLTDNPQQKLKDLFGYYIERNFATKEYRETVLEKGMRKWLYELNVGERFERAQIGDEGYHATFPFVERRDNLAVKAIKPLHLGQNTPSKILEHGGAWVFRVRELRRREALPEKVLFAVDGPGNTRDRKREAAYGQAVDMLGDTGVKLVPYDAKDKLRDFALAF